MTRPRKRRSFAILYVHLAWIYLGVLERANALNDSNAAATNTSENELVMDCNAVQSAAAYGLTWLSTEDNLPPKSIVKYAGIGVDEGDPFIPQCSLSTPDLCDWILAGKSTEWTVTSSLDHYLGPILDYRWEEFPEIRTDGSEKLQKPIFVGSGTVAISVKTARDAHIKLSFGEDPTSSPTYYIILGGWLNGLSVIRACPRGIPGRKGEPALERCYHRRQQNEEKNVTSSWQWKHFIISLAPDGEISVNRTEGPQLLKWKDPHSFVTREGANNSFYLNFRTQDTIGKWKIHAASHSLIKPSKSDGELVRLFSPYFKINQSTFCVTLLHFMSTRKNIPGMGLMVDKKTYVNMISQQIGKDKGWTLIKYTGKVNKEYFGKNANFIISVNRNQSSPIAIQDFRTCPKMGIRRIAQLRIQRNEMRPNEHFVCLPLPNPKEMYLQCPPVKIETIDGVCVFMTKYNRSVSKSSCKCKSLNVTCHPPCNATSHNYNSVSTSCRPDLKTCSFHSSIVIDHEKERGESTSSQSWTDTDETTLWSTTESTFNWTTTLEPEVTESESKIEESLRPMPIQELKVTSRRPYWLQIRWSSPEFVKFQNCTGFQINWWKSESDKVDEIIEGEKWEQILEKGPHTLCPGEEDGYFCATLWNLESSQNYTITVKLWCSDNETMDEPAMRVSSKTLEEPWGPSHIYVSNRTESAITLVWKARLPPATNMQNAFQVSYRESLLHSSNHTWNVVKVIANEGTDNFTYHIGNLSSAVLYEFCVHLVILNDNHTNLNENGESTETKHHLMEFNFRENLTSICTLTRTLLKRTYIPSRTILYRSCSWTHGHLNLSVVMNFNYSEGKDQLKPRAYLLCLTNIKSHSKIFDQHIYDELLKELGVKEFHIAAEFSKNLLNEIDFNLGDGRKTNGTYGNFVNAPLNSSDINWGDLKFDVILIAVNEKNGERRYSWQKALYPAECTSHRSFTFLIICVGVMILFLALGVTGILFWKYHNSKNFMSDCISKMSTLCCKRNDAASEWKDLQTKKLNSLHLESIEPDDQNEYSSDSGHESSLAQPNSFS
ncbi:uncharacterized protein [Hetaerina americana]|uniref:uncharacterized protein n=1 Tax=Hetaerina americana TaxID=62018 RepID=UPI003A7F5582